MRRSRWGGGGVGAGGGASEAEAGATETDAGATDTGTGASGDADTGARAIETGTGATKTGVRAAEPGAGATETAAGGTATGGGARATGAAVAEAGAGATGAGAAAAAPAAAFSDASTFRSMSSWNKAIWACTRKRNARPSPTTQPTRTPASAPISIVATPKRDGIGHTEASGVSGTPPKTTPRMPPATAEPTRTESAFLRSCSAKRSMTRGSYEAPGPTSL